MRSVAATVSARARKRFITELGGAKLWCVHWLRLTVSAVVLSLSAWGAQSGPKDVAFAELVQHPAAYDGQLVRVRGVCVFGWEGDNFLLDPATPATVRSGAVPHLWIDPIESRDNSARYTTKVSDIGAMQR
jgi:hypothetical protein